MIWSSAIESTSLARGFGERLCRGRVSGGYRQSELEQLDGRRNVTARCLDHPQPRDRFRILRRDTYSLPVESLRLDRSSERDHCPPCPEVDLLIPRGMIGRLLGGADRFVGATDARVGEAE